MKKTFFGLFILSFILSIVVAIEFSVEYGHYFVGGNYDKEDPESAWIWIDTTGDYNPNYIFWFPNLRMPRISIKRLLFYVFYSFEGFWWGKTKKRS
jgi:hypothetical protein